MSIGGESFVCNQNYTLLLLGLRVIWLKRKFVNFSFISSGGHFLKRYLR